MLRRNLTIGCCVLFLGACAAVPADRDVEGDDPYKHGELALSRDGRYVPAPDVAAAGEAQNGSYQSAGSWNGGRNCGGGLLDGARRLGDYLVGHYAAARYDGYACRQNTANRSEMSMHGSGRAIDLYVPLSRGDADNDLGDPIADFLIRNASDIGVQFFIWDRTKWNISYSGRKDRAYGGPHPHHDHLHIELTEAGAAMDTPFFSGGGATPTPDSPADDPTIGGSDPVPPPATGSGCTDTCPYRGDGECDDGGPGSLYSLCDLGTDCMDCGPRSTTGTTPSTPTPSTRARARARARARYVDGLHGHLPLCGGRRV